MVIEIKKFIPFWLLVLLSVCPVSLAADNLFPAKELQIDQVIQNEMQARELVGVAAGVIVDGRIAYLKGHGYEDQERNMPVSLKTLFRWASISKTLTAVATMQLSEKGMLDINRDVRHLVAEFPDKGTPITPRDLLCHQGGIVHYTNGQVIRTERDYADPHPFKSVIWAMDTFKESPLVAKPGSKFSYTTHGYILLSAVVERAGKKEFAHQIRDRIALPLEMTTLRPDYQWETIPNRAVGYRKRDDKVVVSSNTDVSWKLGGGGYLSSIGDLARYAAGLLNGRLLKPETRNLMWTPQATRTGKFTGYGLGFGFWNYRDGKLVGHSPQNKGARLVGHGGGQEKTRTLMALWPGRKQGVVVMTNSEHANTRRLVEIILGVLTVPGKSNNQ